MLLQFTNVLLGYILISLLSYGCSTASHSSPNAQENLGKGIVVGSRAEQAKHQLLFLSWPSSQTITGQVKKIEGAAYVLQNTGQHDIRLPLDQETTIDRPAHIGDWIEAYTDSSGRALQIRNIDEEMLSEEYE
ncbi:MAG: hypothetical protein MRJ96_10505 [Nitrospirales bacterium]|nr:hypothetical protein [Nitrospira sp.]MDR4501869.1 hypothetical protein [Nitrospirales bacterium]